MSSAGVDGGGDAGGGGPVVAAPPAAAVAAAPAVEIPNDMEVIVVDEPPPQDHGNPDAKQQQQQQQQQQEPEVAHTSLSKWPESLPHPESHYVLSVVCGNSRYHWALHGPACNEFRARLFWKTAAPKPATKHVSGRGRGSKTTTTVTREAAPSAEDFFPKYFPERASRLLLGNEKEEEKKEEEPPPATDDKSKSNTPTPPASTRPVVQKLLPLFVVQRIPILTIYVISTNATGLADLQHLVSRLPTRLISLQGQDFFNPRTCMPPSYVGMGVDRLAALCAAEQIHGGPALVIDGGTATTFTATAIREEPAAEADESKPAAMVVAATVAETTNNASVSVWNTVKVRGGGIGPGLNTKFTALYSRTSALPQIRYHEVRDYVQQCKQQQENGTGAVQPFSVLDARGTTEAMMGYVLRETACHLQSVIATWAKEAMSSPAFQKRRQEKLDALAVFAEDNVAFDVDNERLVGDAGHVVNHNLTVVLTGGDADIIWDLLDPTHNDQGHTDGPSGPVLHPDTVLPELPCKVEFEQRKHIIHEGISYVLTMHSKRHEKVPKQDISDVLVGQRVTKKLQGRLMARGTVLSCPAETNDSDADEDVYQIMYDDGNRAELNADELYEALLLYNKEGEGQGNKASGGRAHAVLDDDLEEMRDAKRKAAKEASKAMEQCVPVIAARIAKLEDEAKASAEANGNGKRVHANGQASGSSKMARSSEEKDAPAPILPPTLDSLAEHPESYLGQRVAKFFSGECFFGEIDSFNSVLKVWGVVYDDGDAEEFDEHEMIKYFKVYKNNKNDDTR